jgi:imidazolonepropionase-like amidohydrolase
MRTLHTLTAAIGIALYTGSPGYAADSETPAAIKSVPPIIVLHCGHMMDSLSGKLLGVTTVVVEGGRVRDVSPGVVTPPGANAIDLATQTCLPGLIDSHVHITVEFNRATYSNVFHWNVADYAVRSTVFARRTLMAGFTTVRNLGDVSNETVALRNAIK